MGDVVGRSCNQARNRELGRFGFSEQHDVRKQLFSDRKAISRGNARGQKSASDRKCRTCKRTAQHLCAHRQNICHFTPGGVGQNRSMTTNVSESKQKTDTTQKQCQFVALIKSFLPHRTLICAVRKYGAVR